ncbi:MAG: OmpA family protein [Bacteroidota bacterium]
MFVYSQTAPNTVISNQANAKFQFKSFPIDSIKSNNVQFSVLESPNFEMSFSNPDSFVFNRETLIVKITYKNIGNKTADTAIVEGMLPPAGLRFVPGSTGGVISGSTVTWKVFNVLAGKSDSVKVKVVVDSTLVVNTQLNIQADLSWQNTSINSSKMFIVSSFPRLDLSLTPETNIVGSGRTLIYRILIKNTGNVPTANTVLYDTISSFGTFLNSSIAPDSIAGNKRLVKWKLGSVPAFSTKELTIGVLIEPNLIEEQITNAAFITASNFSQGDNAFTSSMIVPVIPKTIAITPEPDFIFGKLNGDSSKISVVLKDSLGQELPDGVPVQFSSTLGTFSNNSTSFSTTIMDGKAIAILRSINVDNNILRSKITVIGGHPAAKTIQDTTNVFFYPGAVTGGVVSGISRLPYKGAIARVFNASQVIVGTDTTKEDGKFFIALRKDVEKYKLEILVIDKFGDSIKTTTDIDPTKFPLPPIIIPNIISGRIEYSITGNPVPAENVTVVLDSIGPAQLIRTNRSSSARKIKNPDALIRVQEQRTDAQGRFKFENLRPAKYVISIDSAEFPNFTGFSFLSDTGSGTFTINLNLQITLDSNVVLLSTAPSVANAGDTVNVGMSIINSGTAEHHAVTVSDTLSPFAKFVSATKGNFSSVSYDSITRIVLWQRDTLKTLDNDTMNLRVVISKNIPDSTKVSNHIWFKSHIRATGSLNSTIIRSKGLVQFFNRFVVSNDTIVAGDSIQHVFKIKNVGTDSLRGLKIIDTLFSAGLSGISLAKAAHDSIRIVDSISIIYIKAIAPEKEDSVSLKLLTDFGLRKDAKILSHAYLLQGDSIVARRDTLLAVKENQNLSTFLKIVKTANKKTAEIGDVVTYQVQISNTSPQFVKTIGVYDLLPYAFQYVKNSARFNGKAIEPTINPTINQLKWNVPDTILTSKHATLVYQLAVGADALESEGVNTAYASALAGLGTLLVSDKSQWQVTVRPGVFTEKGLIIGKVFYDDNRNTFQDGGENGEKGIEIWMEDGTRIITGDDGKFSLPEVKPGQHVMRVNEVTLPKKTELLIGNNSFAKDPTSRFVRVTEGGIAKANFYLKRNVADSLVQTLSKVNKLIAVRQLKPKYLYEDTLRKLKVDTVQMYVSFTYSGNKPVASIEIIDQLSDRLHIVPNSFTYNGRTINPMVGDNIINFKLGRARDVFSGVVSYKVVATDLSHTGMLLPSTSMIKVTSMDSIVVESNKIYVENVIRDTTKNRIETSEIMISSNNPRISNHLSDSISITAGDAVFFKTSLYIDPKKKIKTVKLLDSLESAFIINERSFTVNGVPLSSKNLSVKVRSSSLSMNTREIPDDLEFIRVASVNLTDLLRSGKNEITYSATLQRANRDTMFRKYSYAIITNQFNEENIVRTNDAKIFVRAGVMSQSLPLETTYVNIPRSSLKVEEKIAEAVKLIESLKQISTKAVVMEGITFELAKATLTTESKVVLDNIARILLSNNEINMQINGYTDNTGNAASNRKMSLNRAKEVTAYLVSQGVDSKRLLPQGFGPTNPIASNKTEEGRAKNRRVEFARVK